MRPTPSPLSRPYLAIVQCRVCRISSTPSKNGNLVTARFSIEYLLGDIVHIGSNLVGKVKKFSIKSPGDAIVHVA
jgi:hypothetical protein